MRLTLELTPKLEERFREGVAQQDVSQVKDVLGLAIEDFVQSLMLTPPPPLTEREWDQIADEIVALVEAGREDPTQPLTDYAISREGIYGDHP